MLLWPCAMIGSTVAEILTRLSEAEARPASGAVAEILTRLSEAEARPASGVARRAAGARRALCNLACDEAAKAAIVDAIPQLVALLSGGTESQAAASAAGALCNLACDDAGRAAIIDADIAPLVALLVLLSGGPASKAPGYAARALDILACDDARKAAIVAADAIPPLVELLSCGPASKAAKRAAGALDCLASDTHTTAAVLEEVARTTADCSFCSSLHAKLRNSASEQLQAVVHEGTDAAALEHSIILARAVPLEKSVIDHAVKRLREVMRREALGLGSLEPPHEFMCPITFEKMRGVCRHQHPCHPRHSHRTLHSRHARPCCVTDPVVASDGHSYERSAILMVINGNRVSPLTRERLRPDVLVPNRNLKKRILEFEGNLLDAADEVSRRRDETEASLRQQLAAANQQANPNPSPNPNLTLALALALASTLALTLTPTPKANPYRKSSQVRTRRARGRASAPGPHASLPFHPASARGNPRDPH